MKNQLKHQVEIPEFLVQIDGPSRAALERCLEEYRKNEQKKGQMNLMLLASRIHNFLCGLWSQLIRDPALMRIIVEQGLSENVENLESFWADAPISLLLCSNERIAEWNLRFRGQAKATDILSFPAALPTEVPNAEPSEGFSGAGGDLLLSLPCWLENCCEFGCKPETELQRLLLHGLLHLLGLEHNATESPSQPQSLMLKYQEALLGFQRSTILPQ